MRHLPSPGAKKASAQPSGWRGGLGCGRERGGETYGGLAFDAAVGGGGGVDADFVDVGVVPAGAAEEDAVKVHGAAVDVVVDVVDCRVVSSDIQ